MAMNIFKLLFPKRHKGKVPPDRFIFGIDNPGTNEPSRSAYAVYKDGAWHNTHPDAKQMIMFERKTEEK